jgi:hypothetical protein
MDPDTVIFTSLPETINTKIEFEKLKNINIVKQYQLEPFEIKIKKDKEKKNFIFFLIISFIFIFIIYLILKHKNGRYRRNYNII